MDLSQESNHSGFAVDDVRENRRAPQNSESTIWILKYWVKRAKLIRLIRSQIAGLLEKMTNPYCNFCGINWGLRGETIENIEEIFLAFWRELIENEKKEGRKGVQIEKRIYETSDIIKWQQYFQKHATFRTICFECMNEVLETKKKNSQISEKTEKTEKLGEKTIFLEKSDRNIERSDKSIIDKLTIDRITEKTDKTLEKVDEDHEKYMMINSLVGVEHKRSVLKDILNLWLKKARNNRKKK